MGPLQKLLPCNFQNHPNIKRSFIFISEVSANNEIFLKESHILSDYQFVIFNYIKETIFFQAKVWANQKMESPNQLSRN